jgi:diacylglycerol kinase family enzyme
VGFDAFISMKFAESGKRGAITYIENVFKSGLKYTPEQYELEFINDGKITKHKYKAFLISCANASQYGNNAYIAPQASVRDGLMDVTIIEPFNIVDAPVMAVQLFNGTINQNLRIKTHKCKKLIINRTAPGEFHYDGEPIVTSSRVEIEIIPSALKCICSPDEGVRELGDNLQTMISEQFNDLRLRSEQILQNGLNTRKKRIARINSKVIRKKNK